jgi:RimJ/RimL family protein N-acetyltransferase
MQTDYLFTSPRLGFRNWKEEDIAMMAEINADADVMKYFPAIQSIGETAAFIEKMQKQLAEKGYCYFAVDKLEDGAFIGFIGLSEKTFEAAFTPCIDIGWRLSKKEWNNGYATEGAKRCLEYGLNELNIPKIVAIAPKINTPSERVMQKIGMVKVSEFIHPLLANDERLQLCVLYQISL